MEWYISPYMLAIAGSWLVAQGAKYVASTIRSRSLSSVRQLYLSGNMPSAHSATVASVTTIIGLEQGIDSAIFGLALMMTLIVMYDAVMVRRSVGEQGVAIRGIIDELPASKTVRIPRSAKGHTPLEVIVGALLGVALGLVVFIATN